MLLINDTSNTINCFDDYLKARRLLEKLDRRRKELLDKVGKDGKINNPDVLKGIDVIEKDIRNQKSIIDSFKGSMPEYDIVILKRNLELYLKRLNMRVSDLEDLLNISAGYISRATNSLDSKKRLSVDVVWQMCRVLNVNIDDFLNRDLSVPTKSLAEVLDFLAKLKDMTDDASSHWKNHGHNIDNIPNIFYKDDEDLKGGSFRYAPLGYENITQGESIRGNVYSVRTGIGVIYIIPLLFGSGEYGYEVYVEVDGNCFFSSHLELICATCEDHSGTLRIKCDELVNAIREHEADFVVSDAAKSLIASFLSDQDFDDDLPFN